MGLQINAVLAIYFGGLNQSQLTKSNVTIDLAESIATQSFASKFPFQAMEFIDNFIPFWFSDKRLRYEDFNIANLIIFYSGLWRKY